MSTKKIVHASLYYDFFRNNMKISNNCLLMSVLVIKKSGIAAGPRNVFC